MGETARWSASKLRLRRVFLVVPLLAALLAAARADAAFPGHNGVIVFASRRAENLFPEIYSTSVYGGDLVNLSRNPAADSAPVGSPDGRLVAFISDRDGYDALYVMNADGSGQRRLTDGLTDKPDETYRWGSPAWSPGSEWIAFSVVVRSVHHDPRATPSSIYLVAAAGGSPRLLAPAGAGPTFSADGRFVAYSSPGPQSSAGPARVGVVALASGSAWQWRGEAPSWSPSGHRLAFLSEGRGLTVADPLTRRRWTLRGSRYAGPPAWSPRGNLIAFFDDVARPGVYTVRAGERRAHRLVDAGEGVSVSWAPDGSWLALRGAQSTYLVARSGRSLRRIGGRADELAWSPDGAWIAWTEPSRGLVFASPTGTPRLISDLGVVSGLAWQRDSRRLLFASTHPTPQQLYAMGADGGAPRQLTNADTDSTAPAVSPDGHRVVFRRDRQLWTMRIDGNGEQQLTSSTDNNWDATWAPDGERIAFTRETSSKSIDLFVMNADGTDVRQLTHTLGAKRAPDWSPNGSWIAYNAGGVRAIRPDGTDDHAIVELAGEPDWSPEGARLVLAGPTTGVVVATADGAALRQLTTPIDHQQDGEAAWAPDGTKIVFVHRRNDIAPGDIWMIDADGSAPTPLTHEPWPDEAPDWQPIP